jgi:hypothetical protein
MDSDRVLEQLFFHPSGDAMLMCARTSKLIFEGTIQKLQNVVCASKNARRCKWFHDRFRRWSSAAERARKGRSAIIQVCDDAGRKAISIFWIMGDAAAAKPVQCPAPSVLLLTRRLPLQFPRHAAIFVEKLPGFAGCPCRATGSEREHNQGESDNPHHLGFTCFLA